MERRGPVARALGDRLSHGVEHAGVGIDLGDPVGLVPHARQGPPGGHASGEGDGFLAQVGARDDCIEDPQHLGLGRGHVTPGCDHLQRRLGADQARQALRAPAAWQQADQDFRQADLGTGDRDPVMAGERVLETPAQRKAVNRGNDRLGAFFEGVIRAALEDRTRLAELADVGPGDEAAPGADQHHRLHRRIGIALVDGRDDALGNPRAQGVHWRIVDSDHADAVFDVEPNQLLVVHVAFLWWIVPGGSGNTAMGRGPAAGTASRFQTSSASSSR